MSAPQTLQARLQGVVENAKRSAATIPDQLKKGSVNLSEVWILSIVYLGATGLVAFLMPSLATTFYGGDGSPGYYSNDWVKCGAISNIALALLAALASTWASSPAQDDVLRVFLAYYALSTVGNLLLVLYGSLSIICFVNAVVSAVLAYFHAQHLKLVSAPRAG